MAKTVIHSIVGSDIHYFEFEEKNQDHFVTKFQCKLTTGKNCQEKCETFIKDFSRSTNTNWIVNKVFNNCVRYEFRKFYVCHLAKKNKRLLKKKGCTRNYECLASINIKFLKITEVTLRRSNLLKQGLNVVITINYEHSHRIQVAQAFSLLRCNEDTKGTFRRYFESGMTASAAKTYHEFFLSENCDGDINVLLANAQVNPTERQVTYFYQQWRSEKYGGRDDQSVIERITIKIEELQKQDILLCLNENPFLVVLITAIMKRAFKAGHADEMIFIDTSGSCDQSSTSVTFIFAATKIGALPIAVILHKNKSENDYLYALKMAKQYLEASCNKLFEPQIIMTDDDSAERNALKVVFPKSRLLLCIFHVTQALWRWLWDLNNKIQKDDRKTIMTLFRHVLYAKTTSDAENFMFQLLNDQTLNKYNNAKAYLEHTWSRREEWCLPFRSDVLHRGNNTNNYCEASIRIFKDIILQRCKAFNICALIDFITGIFENYHKNRLLKFANTRGRNLTLAYNKFSRNIRDIEEITHISHLNYRVKHKSDYFEVNIETECCNCYFGQGGQYCKHLCAVEQKYGLSLKNSLLLSKTDLQDFAKIALGETYLPAFYDDINSNKNVDSEEPNESSCTEHNISVQSHQSETVNSSFDLPIAETISQDYNATIDKMQAEFIRISEILKKGQCPSNITVIKKFVTTLEKVQTPSQIVSMFSHTTRFNRSRKIHVQPTAVSRRKERGLIGNSRIQSGRPSKLEEKKKRRKPHNISLSIEKNESSAKKH